MKFDKNNLLTKQHDLMQSRADCLEKATKAYESGNMSEYQTEFDKVTGYNKQLEQVAGLIAECDKEFTPSQLEALKGDGARETHVSGLLMDKIRGTEKYASAWMDAMRKGVNPDKCHGVEGFAPLFEAERASKALTIGGGATPGEDGGFLVPIDFENRVNELLKEYVDLSSLVTVEQVNVNAGWRAVDDAGTRTTLTKVAEMGEIKEGQKPSFKRIAYNCEKYADKIVVSNELLADTSVLIPYLAGWWAPKYIMTKNNLILTKLNALTFSALAGDTDAAQIKAMKHLINTGLNTAYAKRATILTNAFGYDTMDGWADSTGRAMLVPDPKGGDFSRFKNKPVIYADEDLIPTVTQAGADYNPFYIGDFKSFCRMFIRQGTRIRSTDIGGKAWDTDSTEIRCTCRMDCQAVDEGAVKYTGTQKADE